MNERALQVSYLIQLLQYVQVGLAVVEGHFEFFAEELSGEPSAVGDVQVTCQAAAGRQNAFDLGPNSLQGDVGVPEDVEEGLGQLGRAGEQGWVRAFVIEGNLARVSV